MPDIASIAFPDVYIYILIYICISCKVYILYRSHKGHLASKLNFLQDGSGPTFSLTFSYNSFSYFTFPDSPYRIALLYLLRHSSQFYLVTSLIFPFNLLPFPVHPTGFSFYIFAGFLVIFILLSSNNNNN